MKVKRILSGLLLVTFLLALVLPLTNCKKSSDPQPPANQDTIYQPISVSGQITLPSNFQTQTSSLTINAGAFSQTTSKADGSFSINLNKDATQLLTVINQNGNPILMNVVIGDQQALPIELNVFTTAISMIFLNPGAVIAEPSISRSIIGIIETLPETNMLAEIISNKITYDPDALIKNDAEIQSALKNAIVSFISRIETLSENKKGENEQIEQFLETKHFKESDTQGHVQKIMHVGDLVITPNSSVSGFSVSATQESSDNYTITVTNSKKRFVNAFLDDGVTGNNLAKAFVPSRKSLISLNPLAPFSKEMNNSLNLSENPSSIIYAYGLGYNDLASLTSAPDWRNRIIKPAVFTGLFDFVAPLLQVITGVRHFNMLGNWDNPAGVFGEIITKLTDVSTAGGAIFVSQLGTKVAAGDYTGAVTLTIVKCVQIIVDNPAYILNWLQEQGVAALGAFASASILPLRIAFVISSGFELGAAIYDFSTSSWLVSYTLTKSTGTNQPPNPPSEPNPSNGATNISTSTYLTWICTDPEGDPLTYDVYFGTSSAPPLVSESQNQTTYTPSSLSSDTTYYWKIVAKDYHQNATTGIIWSFTTTGSSGGEQPCPEVPTIIYDGRTYHTVQIGTQCWLKENLNIGTKILSSQNQINNGIIEKYCYDDNESNCETYGGLYQWDELMQHVTTSGTKGICPDGWHIPTDSEWTELVTFLGGETVAGGYVKSTTGWSNNGNGTNSSGFTALPSGYRYGGGYFNGLSANAYFWSSSVAEGYTSWSRSLSNIDDRFPRGESYKSYGISARCIKD